MANLNNETTSAVNDLNDQVAALIQATDAFIDGSVSDLTLQLTEAQRKLEASAASLESAVYGSISNGRGNALPSLIAEFSKQVYIQGPRTLEKGVEFDGMFDLYRASSKWVLGPGAEFVEYAPHEPAYAYDPNTNHCLGIHLHSYKTDNLITYSEDVSQWGRNSPAQLGAKDGPVWSGITPYKISRDTSGNAATFVPPSSKGETGKWYTYQIAVASGTANEVDLTLRWFRDGGWVRNTLYLDTGEWRNTNVGMSDDGNTALIYWNAPKVLGEGVVLASVTAYVERSGDEAEIDLYLGNAVSSNEYIYIYFAQMIPGTYYDDLYVPTNGASSSSTADVLKLGWNSGYAARGGDWTFYADLTLSYSSNFMAYWLMGNYQNYRGLGMTIDSASTRFYHVAQIPDTRFQLGNSMPLDGNEIRSGVSFNHDTGKVYGGVRGSTGEMDLSSNNFREFTEHVYLMPGRALRGAGGKNAGIVRRMLAYSEAHSRSKLSEMTND